MKVTKVEHVGIAVPSVAEAEKLYAGVLGMPVVARESLDDRKLRVVKVQGGDCVLELLEPMPGEAVISKFLAGRGPGIHHICLEVDDLRAAVAELKAKGYEPLHEPRPGAGGRLVVFLKPKQTLGTLIELNSPAGNE